MWVFIDAPFLMKNLDLGYGWFNWMLLSWDFEVYFFQAMNKSYLMCCRHERSLRLRVELWVDQVFEQKKKKSFRFPKLPRIHSLNWRKAPFKYVFIYHNTSIMCSKCISIAFGHVQSWFNGRLKPRWHQWTQRDWTTSIAASAVNPEMI